MRLGLLNTKISGKSIVSKKKKNMCQCTLACDMSTLDFAEETVSKGYNLNFGTISGFKLSSFKCHCSDWYPATQGSAPGQNS